MITKLRDKLKHGLGLTWQRSMIFERASRPKFATRAIMREGLYAHAGFGFTRGEIATRSDGVLLFRAWPPDEYDEDLPEGLNPPDTRMLSVLFANVLVYPYTDGLWKTLNTSMLLLARVSEALDSSDPDALRKSLDLKAFFHAITTPPKLPEV